MVSIKQADKSAEPAVTWRRVEFDFAQLIEIHSEFGERGMGLLDHLHRIDQ